MRAVFIDSGGWLSVVIQTDRYHAAGSTYYKQLLDERARLITSDYVLDEVITRLRYDVGHHAARQFIELISKAKVSGVLEIVYVDESLWQEAVDLFLQYADVRLSFTDCSSFAILRRLRITEVFGFDAHFGLIGVMLQPQP